MWIGLRQSPIGPPPGGALPPPPPQPTKDQKSLTAPVRTWEYTGNPLGQCTVLQVLLLSENRLTSLAGLECCQGTLWKLDVRSNQIHDLTAFLSMEHLGEVDLGQNNVSYDELVKLSHVHIMSLRLDGNPLLVGGGGSSGSGKCLTTMSIPRQPRAVD